MEERKIQHRAARGTTVAFFGFVLSTLQTLVQVPVFLHYLGASNYGIWLAVLAAFSLITSLDIGHQAYVGNIVSAHYASDREQMRRALGSGLRVTVLLAMAEVLITTLFVLAGALGWQTGLPNTTQAVVSLLVLVVHYSATVAVAGMLVKQYAPAGYFTIQSLWTQTVRFAQFCLCVTVLTLGGRLIEVALVYALVGAAGNLLMWRDCVNRFGKLDAIWADGEWRTGFRNWSSSLVLSLNLFIDQIGQNGLILLLARTTSVASVPVFATLRTACNTFITVFNTLHYPVLADLARYHSTHEYRKVCGLFRTLWYLQGWVIYFGILFAIPTFGALYGIWTHGELPFEAELFRLLLLTIAVRCAGSPFYSFYYSANDLVVQSWMTLCRMVPPLLYVLFFYSWGGLTGLGWAILAAEVAASGVVFGARWRSYERRHRDARLIRSAAVIEVVQVAVLATIISAISPEGSVDSWILAAGVALGVGLQIWRWESMPADLRNLLKDGLAQMWKSYGLPRTNPLT